MSPSSRSAGTLKRSTKVATTSKRARPKSTTATTSRNGVEKPSAAKAAKLYHEKKKRRKLSHVPSQLDNDITDISGSRSITQTGGKSLTALSTSYEVVSHPSTPDKGEESDDSLSSGGSEIPAVITPEIRKRREQKSQDRLTASVSPTVKPVSCVVPQASASQAHKLQSSRGKRTASQAFTETGQFLSANSTNQSTEVDEEMVGDINVIVKVANREQNARHISTSSAEGVESHQSTSITHDRTSEPSPASDLSFPEPKNLELGPLMTPTTSSPTEPTPGTIRRPAQLGPTTTPAKNPGNKDFPINSILVSGHRILPTSTSGKKLLYLVDWAGNYLPSWEPAINISDSSLASYDARMKQCKDFRATTEGKDLYSERVIDKIVFEEGGSYLLAYAGDWNCEWMKKKVLAKKGCGRKLVRDWKERKLGFTNGEQVTE
jgi:hypothetical protein